MYAELHQSTVDHPPVGQPEQEVLVTWEDGELKIEPATVEIAAGQGVVWIIEGLPPDTLPRVSFKPTIEHRDLLGPFVNIRQAIEVVDGRALTLIIGQGNTGNPGSYSYVVQVYEGSESPLAAPLCTSSPATVENHSENLDSCPIVKVSSQEDGQLVVGALVVPCYSGDTVIWDFRDAQIQLDPNILSYPQIVFVPFPGGAFTNSFYGPFENVSWNHHMVWASGAGEDPGAFHYLAALYEIDISDVPRRLFESSSDPIVDDRGNPGNSGGPGFLVEPHWQG